MTRRWLVAGAASAVGLRAAEEVGSLSGDITDDAGRAVPGAEVKAQHTVRQNTHTATSTNDGRYRFASLPGGTYNLYVSRRGYCSVWIRQVVVRAGENRRNVTLPIDTACQPKSGR